MLDFIYFLTELYLLNQLICSLVLKKTHFFPFHFSLNVNIIQSQIYNAHNYCGLITWKQPELYAWLHTLEENYSRNQQCDATTDRVIVIK